MAKTTTLRAGTSPFAHLLSGVAAAAARVTGKRADDDGIDPEDEGEIDQGELDDDVEDDVEDVEEGGNPEPAPDGKKGKKAKGKKAEDDEPEADDGDYDDEKEKAAWRAGLAAGAVRENKRCAAIFAAPAAAVRPDVAAQLAFRTRQTSAEAIGVLTATAEPGTPRGTRDRLGDRMAERRDPAPGAAGGRAEPTFAQAAAAAMKKIGR